MESSPGCWAAFGEVLAREYSDPSCFEVHRLSVDTYAVQHPGQPSRQSIQSVGLHLIRLCHFLEHDLAAADANDIMLKAGKIKQSFTWLEPPASLGDVTVLDVQSSQTPMEHKANVRLWAQSAWKAWTPHHATVREWIARCLVRTGQTCTNT
jgi:hypothetical protein